jgi:hypothetical protein
VSRRPVGVRIRLARQYAPWGGRPHDARSAPPAPSEASLVRSAVLSAFGVRVGPTDRGPTCPVVGARSAVRDRGVPPSTPSPGTVGPGVTRRPGCRPGGSDPSEDRWARRRRWSSRTGTPHSGSVSVVEPARRTRIRVGSVGSLWPPHRRRRVSGRSPSNPDPDDRRGDHFGGDGRVGTDASGPRGTPGPRRPHRSVLRTPVATCSGSATATSSHRSTSLRPTRLPSRRPTGIR